MNLQLALIILGALALTLVVVLSYARGRFSLRRIATEWMNGLPSVDALIDRLGSVLHLRQFDRTRQGGLELCCQFQIQLPQAHVRWSLGPERIHAG